MFDIKNLTIFDCLYENYKISKTIRLIELFGGVGSQAMALKNLEVDFEHYKLVEIDRYCIASYNAIHKTNFVTKDITKIHADDLEIVETDKYEYIVTYSFPCQDLSISGRQRGMEKGSGTRSGLLWEVERLLDECQELPQILLMENVPEIIGKKNRKDFQSWELKLQQLGYMNYVEILNAKNYGIPQNRRRCFMISVLGKYNYNFPTPFKLNLRLGDMLENEDEVDEKFYLSDKTIKRMLNTKFNQCSLKKALVSKDGIANTILARFEGAPQVINQPLCLNSKVDGKQPSVQKRIYDSNGISTSITTSYMPSIAIPEATKKEAYEGDGAYINRPHQKRGVVQHDMIQTLKTNGNDVGVVVNVFLRIRKLTPLECWRLMGFKDEDFEEASKVNSNSQFYKQAGNSIVVNVLEAIFKQLL